MLGRRIPEFGRLSVVWGRHCRVAVVPSDTVAQVRGLYADGAGNGHSPGETQDAREVGASPVEMKCAERLRLYKAGLCG